MWYPTNKSVFKIDEEDLPIISAFSWWELPSGYIYSEVERKKFYAHRLVTNFPKEVDHKDRDKRNNMKSNLRSVTRRENNNNLKTNGIFGAGVRYRNTHKFIFRIDINGHEFNLSGLPDPLTPKILYNTVKNEMEDW